jgi:hypothetical protein
MDALAIRRQDVQAPPILGEIPNAQFRLRPRGAARGRIHRGKRDDELRLVQSVVGERQTVFCEIGDGERSLVLEQLKLEDDRVRRVRIGGPFERFG